MLTVKHKVCDTAVKTSEREHQVVFWIVLELVFNLFCIFMVDILTNGQGPNKVLLSTSRVSLRTSFWFKSSSYSLILVWGSWSP